MAVLTDLPSELLTKSFSRLSRQELYSVALSCQRFQHAAYQQLYGTLSWQRQSSLTARKVCLLLRSLAESPALGRHVLHVEFFEDPVYDFSSKPLATWHGLGVTEIETILQWVPNFGLSHSDLWTASVQSGATYASALLSLAFFPNLKSLLLGPDFIRNSMLLCSLFDSARSIGNRGTPPPATQIRFPRLHHVQLGSSPRTVAVIQSPTSSFKHLYKVLHTPSLEHLTIELPSAGEMYWPSLSDRPSLASLHTLQLPNSAAEPLALKELLSTKPPLKELLFDYTILDLDLVSDLYSFNLTYLSSALSHVRPTLQKLTLSIEFDEDGLSQQEESPFVGTLDTFSTFPHLTYLNMPLSLLKCRSESTSIEDLSHRLISALPPSLRELYLNDEYVSWVCPELEARTWLELVKSVLASRIDAGKGAGQLDRVVCVGDRVSKYENEFEEICKTYGVVGSLQTSYE